MIDISNLDKFKDVYLELLKHEAGEELVEDDLVKPFTDAVGLGALDLGPGVVDIFHRQVQLILVAVAPTVFRSPVRQHSR